MPENENTQPVDLITPNSDAESSPTPRTPEVDPTETDQVVDPKMVEACRELNCSNPKGWDLLNKGELEGYYVGSQMRITRPSLDSYKIRHKYIPRKELKGKGSLTAARKKASRSRAGTQA